MAVYLIQVEIGVPKGKNCAFSHFGVRYIIKFRVGLIMAVYFMLVEIGIPKDKHCKLSLSAIFPL